MKNLFILTLSALVLWSCGSGNSQDTASDTTENSDSVSSQNEIVENNEKEVTEAEGDDFLKLEENSFVGITLPFERKAMLGDLKNALPGYDIAKAIGSQDGPDFPYFSVAREKEEVAMVKMNDEDTLVVDQLYLLLPDIIDQYGMAVGDSLDALLETRGNEPSIYVGDHWRVYLGYPDSKIVYELSGDFNMPIDETTLGSELTVDQVKGAVIEYIIWQN
jgi:hypothetical protein